LAEVRELPVRQRTALLLNLRDSNGNGVIELLPAWGFASLAEIAALLEMSEKELAAIWDELPLEDMAIAELMDLSRQQVINLRKAARHRIARRVLRPEGNTARAFSSRSGEGVLGRAGKAFAAVFRRTGNS